MRQLVLIDGEPVGALAGVSDDAADPAPEAEFESLLAMSARGSAGLGPESRAAALDSYRADCEIARSAQIVDGLDCPILLVIPDEYAGVGIAPARVDALRQVARENWEVHPKR